MELKEFKDISINNVIGEKGIKIVISKRIKGSNEWVRVKDITIDENLDVKVFDIQKGIK